PGERIRAHLTDLDLSGDVDVWSWSRESGLQGPMNASEAGGADGVWTPSVVGPEVVIGVEANRSGLPESYEFAIDKVAEMVATTADPRWLTGPCLGAHACSPPPPVVDEAKTAVGRMTFISGGASYVCTGTLLNDSDNTSAIPWFLTAEHCISAQTEASS